MYADPSEYVDQAEARPDIVAQLADRIAFYQSAVFSPDRGSDDGAACKAAMEQYRGFWGPFVP